MNSSQPREWVNDQEALFLDTVISLALDIQAEVARILDICDDPATLRAAKRIEATAAGIQGRARAYRPRLVELREWADLPRNGSK